MSYKIVNRDPVEPEPEPPSPRFAKVEAAILVTISLAISYAILRPIGRW